MANSIECKSCGNIFHTDQNRCPYCGTPNLNATNQKSSNNEGPRPRPAQFNTFNDTPRYNFTTSKSNINVCLLIFLVVVFWPAAIVYVIIKMNNKG